jgi:hypothetical protein
VWGTVYDGELSHKSLARILRRENNAGLLVHNREIIGELAGVEPIVSREEWERMCAVLDGRKTGRPPADVHPLPGTPPGAHAFRCRQSVVAILIQPNA